MKKYVIVSIVLGTVLTAGAMLISQFESWDNLIEQSPDIVIAKCATSLETTKSENRIILNGIISSDIDVISVLKGNSNVGLSHLHSSYQPQQGESFLIFANYEPNVGFRAAEGYRVIPLNQYFQTNQLDGKTLREQVQLILNSRLKDLNDEIARDNDEKSRIQMDMSSNATAIIKMNPSGTSASFHSIQ